MQPIPASTSSASPTSARPRRDATPAQPRQRARRTLTSADPHTPRSLPLTLLHRAVALQAGREVQAKIMVGGPGEGVALAKAEHITPLEERIKRLHSKMISVRDLQDRQREQARA